MWILIGARTFPQSHLEQLASQIDRQQAALTEAERRNQELQERVTEAGRLWSVDLEKWRGLAYKRAEQVRALEAERGWGGWTPTAENINALPSSLRQYIHDLETRCDPAGEVQALRCAQEDVVALQAQLTEAESALSAWRSWAQFVYLEGGPVTKSDDELWIAVCAEHDTDLAGVKSALSAAQQEARHWHDEADRVSGSALVVASEYTARLEAAQQELKQEREAHRVCSRGQQLILDQLNKAQQEIARLKALLDKDLDPCNPLPPRASNY